MVESMQDGSSHGGSGGDSGVFFEGDDCYGNCLTHCQIDVHLESRMGFGGSMS